MNEQMQALEHSVARLRSIVEPLGPDELRRPAYPSEWNIAAVLSHLGSAAVIMEERFKAGLAGREFDEGFAAPVWDEWNAKAPEAQAADGLAADRELIEYVESLTDDDIRDVIFAIGPLQLDFARLLGLRVNEHAIHTWDVEVALDPAASIPVEAASLVVDSLEMMARFTGKPTGVEHTVNVHTTDPARDFTLTLGAESVSLANAETTSTPDLELPAEALIRLVYGRLDPEHTPPVRGSVDLDELRRAFPGV